MSAPHVAGVVALMLELHPELSYDEISDVLQDTGRSSTFTGSLPNDLWGYGMIDAKSVIDSLVATHMPEFDPDAVDTPVETSPEPSVAAGSSGGGCSLTGNLGSTHYLQVLFMFMAMGAIIIAIIGLVRVLGMRLANRIKT